MAYSGKDSPKLRADVIACGRISRAHARGYRANNLTVDGTHTVDLMRWYAGYISVEWLFT